MLRALALVRAFEAAAPPGVHNLEVAHTLVLLFGLVAMIPAVSYSATVYWSSNMSYHTTETNRRWTQQTGMLTSTRR